MNNRFERHLPLSPSIQSFLNRNKHICDPTKKSSSHSNRKSNKNTKTSAENRWLIKIANDYEKVTHNLIRLMHPSPYVRNTTTVSKFAMKVETPVSINFYDETSESTLIGFLANHRNNWGFTRGNSELFCGNIGVLLIDCFGIDLWTLLNSFDLSYRSSAVFNSNTIKGAIF